MVHLCSLVETRVLGVQPSMEYRHNRLVLEVVAKVCLGFRNVIGILWMAATRASLGDRLVPK